jgi:predicted TIM-barrel fold metal-dependent hydrolase
MYFGCTEYPYAPIRQRVRQAIQAFGADRLLWASDHTVLRPAITWSDLVHFVRDDTELSHEEKQLIMGGNARRLFAWLEESQ